MKAVILWLCFLLTLENTVASALKKFVQHANGEIVALPEKVLNEDDIFRPWSSWTSCSVVEGQGVMKRTRECRNANCKVDSEVLQDVMKCFMQPCNCACQKPGEFLRKKSTVSPTTKALQTCSRSLGASYRGFLPNSSFTASSFLEHSKRPLHGRLNSPSTWCPKTRNPGLEYLMIDLKQELKICAVAMQGDQLSDQWTRDYYIEYSQDGDKWIDVTLPNGKTKVFSGNQDGTNVSREALPSTIVAQYVRFYPLQFHKWPCLKVDLIGPELPKMKSPIDPKGCKNSPMGASHDGSLANSVFSASSSYEDNEAFKARLHGPSAWCSMSSNPGVDFIQISLDQETTVCAVATQGVSDSNGDSWVTSYLVAFSTDGTEWRTIQEYGKNKVFKGNTDTASVFKQGFPLPIKAKYIRLYPVAYHDWVCMRVELYGVAPQICEGLGLASGGALPDANFQAHSSYVGEEAYLGRLHGNKAWCARDNVNGAYLQIDLGTVAELCSVETQGYAERSYWTSRYLVKFSIDNSTWSTVYERENFKLFEGNSDGSSVIRQIFPYPILARYVRLYPQQYEVWMCLRVELHGNVMKKIDLPTSQVTTTESRTSSSTRKESVITKIKPTNHHSPNVLETIQPTPRIKIMSQLISRSKSTNISTKEANPTDSSISDCYKHPLGASDGGRLATSAFSASSSWRSQKPHFGRLDGNSGWCSDSLKQGTFLQVDLGFVTNVCAIATQGVEKDNDWVRSFYVRYSEDGVNWLTIQENNKDKFFKGNENSKTVVKNGFPSPVMARYVQVFPDMFDGWMCLRVEVYGEDISAKALSLPPLPAI